MKSYHHHGMTHSRLYECWRDMKSRCNNPKNKRYYDYGGRGITVCKEWEESFIPFWQWALENGYSDDLTIDRIDNDKGYSPGNCRWASHYEQVHNQRKRKSKLGVTGVREYKCGCYIAYVCIGHKYIQIGRFPSIDEAVIAREKYKRRNNML